MYELASMDKDFNDTMPQMLLFLVVREAVCIEIQYTLHVRVEKLSYMYYHFSVLQHTNLIGKGPSGPFPQCLL